MISRGRKLALALVLLALAGGFAFAAVRLAGLLGGTPGKASVQVPVRWKQVKDSVGHRKHLQAGDVKCRDCHLFDANGFIAPGTLPCATCHADQEVFVHTSPLASAATDCFSCHDFGGDPGIKPWACARCHVEPDAPAVTHFDQECKSCHRPHQDPQLLPQRCQDCHDDIGKIEHGRRVVAGATTCLDCHESHDQSIAASRRCQACHDRQRPVVPATALRGGHDRCVQCHEPHRFSKQGVRACRSCHDQPRTLGAPEVRAHVDCKSCHLPHDASAASAAARCVGCHKTTRSAHPPDAKGKACLACHPAHPAANVVLSAKGALACSSCHREAGLDSAFHDEKTACTACHAPHRGPPSGGASVAATAFVQRGTESCVRCHAPKVGKVSGLAGHRDCLKCHAGANHNPDRAPAGCPTCHVVQARTAPPDHQDCRACHDSHDGKLRPKAACRSCHEEKARVGPHVGLAGGCLTCHRAHGPGGVAKPPACLDCHDRRALPNLHQGEGHEKCADCHGPHLAEPRRDRASCLRCHADQRDHEPGAALCSGCHPFTGRARPLLR